MKTTIFTAILAVGLFLRPQPTPIANNGSVLDNLSTISVSQQTSPQVLNAAEMKTITGNGITGCSQTRDANGDVYVTCCVDLWIFAVCVAVNWSAVERIIPFM